MHLSMDGLPCFQCAAVMLDWVHYIYIYIERERLDVYIYIYIERERIERERDVYTHMRDCVESICRCVAYSFMLLMSTSCLRASLSASACVYVYIYIYIYIYTHTHTHMCDRAQKRLAHQEARLKLV